MNPSEWKMLPWRYEERKKFNQSLSKHQQPMIVEVELRCRYEDGAELGIRERWIPSALSQLVIPDDNATRIQYAVAQIVAKLDQYWEHHQEEYKKAVEESTGVTP